ncbi:MAG: class I SAM-dependent methyltransferase [Blastococcus sp.]
MFRRFRHSARVRLIEAVRDGTGHELEPVRSELGALSAELAALRHEVGTLRERVDAAEGGLRDHMVAWERRTRRDILTAVDQEAMTSSAAFVRTELGAAPPYFNKSDTLRAAMARAPRDGLYLEFGVASGSTLRLIAECGPAGNVFGFDSFEGLPEFWRPGFDAGAFKTDQLPDVPGAELVPGWFDDTLPGFLEEHPEPVSFLHLDADLYSSTRTVLLALAPRMHEGTVIVFDEYFNFPGWEEHEHRAWVEFVAETGLRFEYLGYTADDEQVVLRLLNAPSAAAETAAPGRDESSSLEPSAP